jgi:L-asparaginase
MEYKMHGPAASPVKITPRIIIHGGAGNVTPRTIPPELHSEYMKALLDIVSLSDRPKFLSYPH